MSRYVVGIDLGTTNSAVAYSEMGGPIKLFRIPQLNAKGVMEALPTLPSFHYLSQPHELPNRDFAVGQWAREQGAKVPTRLVQSAKSWLINAAANRKEAILPFEAADDARKLTPVEASASYLRHIRMAWNAHFKDPLEEQEVVLTVPASFDEVARSLTVEAALLAGIPHPTLLEEPQAAFYNWLSTHEKETLEKGASILVCDVGGGTTDFSLIEVTEGGFQRMAVGKHLLLGGDNMDTALCHYMETQLTEQLDRTQWLALRHQARAAKEAILAGASRHSIWIPGKGSRLVGGGLSLEISAEEVASVLVDGFFGLYDFDQARHLIQGSDLHNVGLPYEPDSSITKHLANFLSHHPKPTYLLFNGGALKPSLFQERLVRSLDLWFGEAKPVKILPSSSLDLAVARGAAYYGKARQGEGIRISGGVPRAYYLEVEKERVLTLVPRGAEEGAELHSEHIFSLLPNRPVSFQLYHSHTRIGDQPGMMLSFEEESMTPLPPIETVLRFGSAQNTRIPVRLTIRLTEIGTLELWVRSEKTDHRWKLEFLLSGYTKEKRLTDETFETSFLEPAKQRLVEAFSVGAQAKLKVLMPTLETVIERPRSEWSPSLLRGLFEPLLVQSEKRGLAQAYAAKFWNLAGFFLRPGRGYPLDDFRIKELWKLHLTEAKLKLDDEVLIQKWICYRRIAAGLSKGQQMQIYSELFPLVYDKKKRQLIVKRKGGYAYAEQLRALASLELVEMPHKVKLGEALVERIVRGHGEACDFWALGRLGARAPLYGTAANVIPSRLCEGWISRLVNISEVQLIFPLTLLARQTDCLEVNLSAATIDQVKMYLEKHAESSDLALLMQKRELTVQEQERCFGDSLPTGLVLKEGVFHGETGSSGA
ncbi:MAG: Chaperone protein HscA [Chlamydiales bacterium]|nr:Chaperone protein HscA [Chlamydiales bacterium]